MAGELFTVESPTGIYVTKELYPTAHVFRMEYLADLFVKDTRDDSLFVTPVQNLREWLEATLAGGAKDVREHSVANTYTRSITTWIDSLKD